MELIKLNDKMSLAEHAEAWWRDMERIVPERNTEEWEDMYEKWIEFAFHIHDWKE